MMSLTGWLPAIVAAIFPIIGIVCSRYSFTFTEDGSVPDRWEDDCRLIPLSDELLERGKRERARTSARVLFDIGALLVVAGVLMGISDGKNLGLISPTALASCGIVVLAVMYGARAIVALWHNRRSNAFNAFYIREASWLYREEAAIRALYFRLNPMPFFSIFPSQLDGYDPTSDSRANATSERSGVGYANRSARSRLTCLPY